MTYTSASGWYSLTLPTDWIAEKQGNLTTIYEASSAATGALQVSAFQVPEGQHIDLATQFSEYLKDKVDSITPDDVRAEEQRGKQVASFGFFDKEERYWVFWMFNKAPKLILISYNCAASHAAAQKSAIESIVGSLEIHP